MTHAIAPELRDLADEDLAALFAADPDDEAARATMLAELARRDRAERLGQARKRMHDEWYDAAYAQYQAADIECRGELVNGAPGWPAARGDQPGRDDFALWTLPEREAMRFATEELRDFWRANPRLSFGQWQRQRAADMREARLEAATATVRDDSEAESFWLTEDAAGITTITGEGGDEPGRHDLTGQSGQPGGDFVDGDDPRGLRRVRTPDAVRPGRDGQQRPSAPARQVRHAGPVQRGSGMLSFDQVTPRETLLLAQRPHLPYGEVVLVFGSGSLGKGRMVQSIVAAVTNGEPAGLDETTQDDAGDVIVVLPEDKQAESAVKRMIAAGVNLRRCWDMTRLPSGVRFKLSASDRTPGHLPELRAAVEQLRAAGRNPRLVVIDPIGAVIGDGTIQTSKGARLFVERLQDFAEQSGVCVLLVAHPVSGGKLQGSWALEQALRVVYHVSRDESDASLRIVRNVKGNDLAPELAGDLRFTIIDGPAGPRAEWVRPVQGNAAPAGGQARPDWRDDLARRRARRGGDAGVPLTPAPPVMVPLTRQEAREAGCRHPRTKYGTPVQCSDCPPARLKAVPGRAV